MYLTRETTRTSRMVADTKRIYSHGALSVTVKMTNSDTTALPVSDAVSYLVTMSKTDLEELLALITKREEEIKKETVK